LEFPFLCKKRLGAPIGAHKSLQHCPIALCSIDAIGQLFNRIWLLRQQPDDLQSLGVSKRFEEVQQYV
jgi:hypothetical protein